MQAQGGGLLTDGMGADGCNISVPGQATATVQAGPGQMAQLDLRALWLSRGDSVRVRVDDGEETLLQGTVLPPPESGGRSFRSKAAGNVTVVMATGELTSLLFVSFAVRAACVTAGGCGGHGDCVGGSCRCSGHYRGSGAHCLRSTSSCAPPPPLP